VFDFSTTPHVTLRVWGWAHEEESFLTMREFLGKPRPREPLCEIYLDRINDTSLVIRDHAGIEVVNQKMLTRGESGEPMTGRYAMKTEVSSEASRMEIERTVRRYGAAAFTYGFSDAQQLALVEFLVKDRRVRFLLGMPDYSSREFTHTPAKGLRRSEAAQADAYEQAVRQRWRALNLVIKAKLEAVETGIVAFDEEFLAQIVLPNGQTVGEAVTPNIARIYELGEVPTELLALPRGGSS
jgi:hypothetical protein